MTAFRDEALAALRDASGGEWTDAHTVAKRMSGQPAPAAVGRALSTLAHTGYCSRRMDEYGVSYRVGLRVVELFDAEGAPDGKLLLWQAGPGIDIERSPAKARLPETLRLTERDVRTMRAACDEALGRAWER